MRDLEVEEIDIDDDELIVRYKDKSFEYFDTLPKNVSHYLYNLQEENERLSLELNTGMIERNNYLSKIDKAIVYIHNHQLVFELSSKEQIQKWFDEFYTELLEILRGEDNE